METAFRALEAESDSSRKSLLWLDLTTVTSRSDLSALLSNDSEVDAWRSDSRELHLFIDRFDEWQLAPPQIGRLFEGELMTLLGEGGDAEKLYLRVVCRSSAWPGNTIGRWPPS